MSKLKAMRFDTLAVHAGQEPDPLSGAVMTPIVLSSTFAQDGPGKPRAYEYSRTDNPTRRTLEHCLAALEGSKHALAFASGCAAMSTILHVLRPGDHVIACDDLYGGSYRILKKVMGPLGLESTQVDLSDPRRLDEVIRPNTKLVWIETPTNPTLKLIDISAVAERCKSRSIPLVVDNTFATPYLQKPLELGATLVVHSTTKYLNGHSDVVGGCVMTNDSGWHEQLRFLQNAIGAVPSPFDCYLVLRGIKTLHLRMERHVQNAHRVAYFLASHPMVERVIYPGLPSHPQHELAKKQMKAAGGMLSFVVRGGDEVARIALSETSVFTCAESLGGVESLIEMPSIMTHGSIPPEQRKALGIVDGFVRISVGVEDPDDLCEDLDQALRKAGKKNGLL
ncbi:MAG: cystathionine gamma-synthase [Sandaracinaceae bacterium]|nr:cystathionine gamma-synthase [Sandaracinaceae bacterium]